jgi:hypothetical protein
MKSKNYSACRSFLILTFICSVSLGTAAAQPAGHLVVLRAPNFGWNLAFNLEIDGRPVGDIVRGRHYHGWLPAGQHVLTVRKVPYVGYVQPTSTVVNIQPGWTYVFTAMFDSQLIYLHPAGAWLTPGAKWQNLGRL